MIEVAGIVVTYNRKDMLKKNLECLLNQEYPLKKIYLIDNCSTDGTYEYVRELINNNKIEYIKLEENLGGSKGFEVGVKKAYEDGYDCVWGMDDDAFPYENALKEIIQVYKMMPTDTCLCSTFNKNNIKKKDYEKTETWVFVGFFVPRIVIEKVGFPRGDLFIYGDDDEYCHRILKNGFKIYKVNKSIIEHKFNIGKEKYEKNILGKKISMDKLCDWRLYYLTRNNILKYKYSELEKYKVIFLTSFKNFLKVLILNPKQIPIFVKAWFHGIIGKTGKVIKP